MPVFQLQVLIYIMRYTEMEFVNEKEILIVIAQDDFFEKCEEISDLA